MAGNIGLQILRGSEEFDTSTSDELLKDGQLFYSKKNKKLYVGTGDVRLKNLIGVPLPCYLEIGGKEATTNTGPYAIHTNKNLTGCKATGSRSIAIGDTCSATAYTAVALGASNQSLSAGSVTLGLTNTVAAGSNAGVALGQNNNVEGSSSIGLGLNNKLNMANNGCVAIGDGNKIQGAGYAEITVPNINKVKWGVAIGNNNRSYCTEAYAIGGHNTVCSYQSSAFGYGNMLRPETSNSTIIGSFNTAGDESLDNSPNEQYLNALIFGMGNKNSKRNQIIIGNFSNPSPDDVFVIGKGNEFKKDKNQTWASTGNIIADQLYHYADGKERKSVLGLNIPDTLNNVYILDNVMSIDKNGKMKVDSIQVDNFEKIIVFIVTILFFIIIEMVFLLLLWFFVCLNGPVKKKYKKRVVKP